MRICEVSAKALSADHGNRSMIVTAISWTAYTAITGWPGAALYFLIMIGAAFGVQPITYVQHCGLGEDSPYCRWSGPKSPGSRARSEWTCQVLRPRRADCALAISRAAVLPSTRVTASAPGTNTISRLDGRPAYSPANA